VAYTVPLDQVLRVRFASSDVMYLQRAARIDRTTVAELVREAAMGAAARVIDAQLRERFLPTTEEASPDDHAR
jgi:uncharacterized protein (DUF1778 family)